MTASQILSQFDLTDAEARLVAADALREAGYVEEATRLLDDDYGFLGTAEELYEVLSALDDAGCRDVSDVPGLVERIEAGPTLWSFEAEDGGDFDPPEPMSLGEAVEAAENWLADGDWEPLAVIRGAVYPQGVSWQNSRHVQTDVTATAPAPREPECPESDDGHDWTSEYEGGCRENPGVWSTGGTSMLFRSHCRLCGMSRTERWCGSQRNPGEHDTIEYGEPDADWVAEHVGE